ncbi:MAG TPA: vitamin B12 dependent-methionine synthase activation domain-containing protein, partial [Pseudomonadales bacterium]
VADIRDEYEVIRRRSSERADRRVLLPLDVARSRAPELDWTGYQPPVPNDPGVHSLTVGLDTLEPFIDWSPFFMTWELAGKYPKILDDTVVGESARSLFADAREMLDWLIRDGRLEAHGVFGLWPANRLAGIEDVVVYQDEHRKGELARLHFLRQQTDKPDGQPDFSLADFIAPPPVPDWIGGFAVTAGVGIEQVLAEHARDDYASIMIKALADRLAEAFAEYLHKQVRTRHWGYAAGENLGNEALIKESYRGIRPAPGYPACPEHSEKVTLFSLLDATHATGMTLTDHYAMLPAASVSGWYFAHPEARYFGIGKIGDDQLADYAARKGVSEHAARALLRPNLQ